MDLNFQEILPRIQEIKPILVLGDLGIDEYVEGSVERISPEAPVPVVRVKKTHDKLGLAANVADNLASLKIPHILAGIIGDDFQGENFLKLCEASHINAEALVQESGRQTTIKQRVLAGAQQICRVDYEQERYFKSDAYAHLLKKITEKVALCSGVIIEDYGKGLFTEKFTQEVIALFRKHQKPVWVDPSRHTRPQIYRQATLVKPNRQEAQIMARTLGLEDSDPRKMLEHLQRELALEMMVITLSEKGMIFKESSQIDSVPTIARSVYDVSGAGDTAIAVLSAMLAANYSLQESIYLANAASAVVVGKRGTACITPKELQKSLEKFQKKYLHA